MNPLLYMKSEWKASKIPLLGLIILLALSVSLGGSIYLIEKTMRKGMNAAGEEFPILIGAPGSSVQLFLSSVYLQAQPLPLLLGNPLGQLETNPNVNWYAPLAFGDRYKDFPIVGTTSDFIHKNKADFILPEGRIFEKLNEAVIGSKVDVPLNTPFTPAHGLIALPEEESHGNSYIPVGRLPQTNTPYDYAILVPIESVWNSHDLMGEHIAHDEEVNKEEILSLSSLPGLSAIVVEPKTFAEAYKIRSQWSTNTSQAVFSGEILTQIFSLIGNIQLILEGISALSLIMTLCSMIFISLFIVMLRKKSIELMKTLGAPSSYLYITFTGSIAFILILGIALGILLATGISFGVSSLLTAKTGIAFTL